MEKIEIFVEIFVGAVGFFDFESVQGFGADNAFDFVVAVDHGENGETRFVELVEDKRPEDFGRFNKNHVGTLYH